MAQSDLLVQSDYAKYLVIRISGLLEQAIAEIIQAHVTAQASPTVVSHTTWRMAVFQNPNVERLLQLVGSFDRRWREELDQELTDAERGALGSINAQRNLVAHGLDSTVSLVQIAQYFAEVRVLLDKVAGKF